MGDLHYFVADTAVNEPLMNDDGRVLVFNDSPTALAATRAKGWLADKNRHCEIIPLNADRWEHFKAQVPYVLVTAKEFDVSNKDELDPSHESAKKGKEAQSNPPCPHCEHGEPHPIVPEHP